MKGAAICTILLSINLDHTESLLTTVIIFLLSYSCYCYNMLSYYHVYDLFLRKTFGKFFRSYSELLSKFCDISFQEYMSKGISHPVFYGDLVYQIRRVKDKPYFISSGSKIVLKTPSTTTVWPIDHRMDYRSCAWSFYSLVQTFPGALHSD